MLHKSHILIMKVTQCCVDEGDKCIFNKNEKKMCINVLIISIYTLSDVGDLSNLIGSLSRTLQQYSPPSEWIMCELGVFPIFLENDL